MSCHECNNKENCAANACAVDKDYNPYMHLNEKETKHVSSGKPSAVRHVTVSKAVHKAEENKAGENKAGENKAGENKAGENKAELKCTKKNCAGCSEHCGDPECHEESHNLNIHHGHHHHHHGADGKKVMHKKLVKIIVALVLFLGVFITDKVVELASINEGPANWVLPFICYFIVFLILGWDILKQAARGIAHGEFLDEMFLISLAALGAFALGIYRGCIGQEPDGFEEGCAVVLFFSIGEFFQGWSLGRSQKNIAKFFGGKLDKNAEVKKAETETFIRKFARHYTPIVVILALVIAIIPPVIGMITGKGIEVSYVNSEGNVFSGPLDLTWMTWIYRALSFLVLSCPCALVISIPLSFFTGIGIASKHNIFMNGSSCLEMIAAGREDEVEFIEENVATKKLGSKGPSVMRIMRKGGAAKTESQGESGGAAKTLSGKAANIVLMEDKATGMEKIRIIAKKTMAIARENIVLSIGIKVAALILSLLGITNMWVAVFADEGVALLAVLNALRVGTIRFKKS